MFSSSNIAASAIFSAWRSIKRTPLAVSACSSLMTEEDHSAGRLLFHPTEKPFWDSTCSFYPIVLKTRWSSEWRMYYYGRDSASWHSGVTPALLSSGRIGMASSVDGINWSRIQGPLRNSAIMDPRDRQVSAFDSVHIGCSDVFYYNGLWWMYYFGGGLETMSLLAGRRVTGMRLRIGLAKSLGNGIDGFDAMREAEPVLDVGSDGEWDDSMVAWARVLPPSASHPLKHWLMTYASMDKRTGPPPGFSIGVAVSQDGHKWNKVGRVLERGVPGSWDDAGVGRRHVIHVDGQYIMFYEGVNKEGMHAIGLAASKDGITWAKVEKGGPVFSACPNSWDSGGVACPHVVKDGDSYLLYYVGYDITKKVSAFGVARTQGNNFRSFSRVRSLH